MIGNFFYALLSLSVMRNLFKSSIITRHLQILFVPLQKIIRYMDTNNMLSKNVILIDASYIDKVATDFTQNFSRMLVRDITKADLALWLDCVALDGQITPGENDIQVILIYTDNLLKSFAPSMIDKEIDGKAFKDNLGEFSMEAYHVASDVTSVGEQFTETLRVLLDAKEVENILIVPDAESYGKDIPELLSKNEKKQATLFTIQPQEGKGFVSQQLGFSVVHALGISGEELKG